MGASGRHDYPCAVCKKNFNDCPHSQADQDNARRDNHIRKIVRQEIKKYMKEQNG